LIRDEMHLASQYSPNVCTKIFSVLKVNQKEGHRGRAFAVDTCAHGQRLRTNQDSDCLKSRLAPPVPPQCGRNWRGFCYEVSSLGAGNATEEATLERDIVEPVKLGLRAELVEGVITGDDMSGRGNRVLPAEAERGPPDGEVA
jgi:hypothetical protein